MTTILVVDDEHSLLDLVSSHLQEDGYAVVTATAGAEALKLAYQHQPDLALIDVMLPDIDGITVCRRLRDMTAIPIIMLTALHAEPMIVQALDAGADDYITKPFGYDELMARIKSVLRRSRRGERTPPAVVTTGNVIIDLARRQVTVDGTVVELTPTEFNLLACLAERPGQVVPHRTLLQKVWGPEYVNQLEYLRIYVAHLRRKIEADPAHPRVLMTQRGIGYYLADV